MEYCPLKVLSVMLYHGSTILDLILYHNPNLKLACFALYHIIINTFMKNNIYRIHSNKRPGHLDKSFRVGTYLFQYLLQGSTQKFMILANFRLIPNRSEFSMLVT